MDFAEPPTRPRTEDQKDSAIRLPGLPPRLAPPERLDPGLYQRHVVGPVPACCGSTERSRGSRPLDQTPEWVPLSSELGGAINEPLPALGPRR
jgi:hypothetical protein